MESSLQVMPQTSSVNCIKVFETKTIRHLTQVCSHLLKVKCGPAQTPVDQDCWYLSDGCGVAFTPVRRVEGDVNRCRSALTGICFMTKTPVLIKNKCIVLKTVLTGVSGGVHTTAITPTTVLNDIIGITFRAIIFSGCRHD